MCNLSKEKQTLRKNQNEILEIKNTVTNMKVACDGLIEKDRTEYPRAVE